ncbi:CPK3, partial [Symbiodinium sp. CCMP2456]
MTQAATAAEFHAPSKEERAAGRALCGALLWPPKAPGLRALCPGLPEAVPPALALALQRGLPDVLLYRCFLLLVRAKQIEEKDEKEAQRAYAPVLVKLKAMGFLVHDSLLLPAQLAKAARSLDGPNLSVSLQPHVPPVLNIKDEASRQLHADHWRQVYLDCMKFFPRFFQPRTRVLAVPPSSEQEVEDLTCHLLLHGFAVLCVVHPTSEKTPKVDACIVVRGIGMLPVPEESSVQGSSCYLGLPPSTKSYGSLAAALASKGLPLALTAAGACRALLMKPLEDETRYFHNRATGESTWSNPALAKAAAPRTKEPEAGLIPGTKDPVQEPKIAPKPWPATKAAEPKAATSAPKHVETSSDQPELSALIVFEDAAGLGFADVARELLLSSGCAILLDRPCPLDMFTLRLLLGCSVRGPGQRDQEGLEASLQLWLHHLQGHRHHLFVVRRSGAVALLLQLCFGPYLRRQFRKSASHGPLTATWPFLHLEEDLRPWPPPMLPCLQSLLSGSPPAHLSGKGPEPEQAGKPISAPVVATACHSRAHASAVVGRLAGELLQSQEVVLVMRGSADETDFQSARERLSVPPL